MRAFLFSLFIASLVGSVHCAGMCGVFVSIATGKLGGESAPKLLFNYHLGRLSTYLLMGSVAGLSGALLDSAGELAGAKTLALYAAGAYLIAMALITAGQLFGLKLGRRRFGLSRFGRRLQVMQVWATALQPKWRSYAVGATTTLLPCGWLYAFVACAAGTGKWSSAVLVMFVFWLGTLPSLSAVHFGLGQLAKQLSQNQLRLASLLLLSISLWMLSGRAALDPVSLAHWADQSQASSPAVPRPGVPPCCAAKPAASGGVAAAMEAAPDVP